MSYVDCPYYEGRGSCDRGCWEEPICRVNEPRSGWNLESPAVRECPVCSARLERVPEGRAVCSSEDGCLAEWDASGRLVQDPDPAFG